MGTRHWKGSRNCWLCSLGHAQICTDVLFQPLTLLDCLHTFCGACLKEWFAFQASTAASIHPYTCPSCRASVRTTQPNATVTTLLEIFLKANPERGKSAEEKQADRAKFTPGDNVLPKLRRRDERDEAERRMLEEVQQLSLREAGIAGGRSAGLGLPRERRRRERSRDGSRESRTSRDERQAPSRTAVPPRAVEHQSSLRSLLSASELDSEDIDEELVRQVLEELVAEGVDLSQIGVAQEEEITERIAEAVRRRQAERQAERQRERRQRRDRSDRMASEGLSSPSPASVPPSVRRAHSRAESGTSTPQTAVGPPISRPGLIDAANRGSRSHPRSSSQGSARGSARAGPRAADEADAPAPRRRQSDNQQRGRLDARQQFRNSLRPSASSNPSSPRTPGFPTAASDSPSSSLPRAGESEAAPAPSASTQPPASRRTPDPDGSQSSPVLPRQTFAEPHLSCQRCARDHIEYELHYNCTRCDGGNYNICMRCYRSGKGCKHWFGFGWTAWPLYERQAPPGGYPPHHEHPHILAGNRYRRPLTPLASSLSPPHVLTSEDDPRQRRESGVFCDICKAHANSCYWKCDYCNEGDWGFCNNCVNQGRHCTHPLLPVAKTASEEAPSDHNATQSTPSTLHPDPGLAPPDHDTSSTTPPLTPKSASLVRGPADLTIAHSTFRPLTFTTLCNFCSYPIPPSHTRYHCLKCNTGDYDICTSCYYKLNVSGRISKDSGSTGWRRCLQGHRMVLVGFEDRDGGQRRIVVRDLVGGHALKEEGGEVKDEENKEDSNTSTRSQVNSLPRMIDDSWKRYDHGSNSHDIRTPSTMGPLAQRHPPDGGVGLRLLATWQYWPDEGVEDELAFPRAAEIREAAAINRDWYWGVYCGAKGLFPANHVTAV